MEIGIEERTGSPISATALTGGEEKEGEEQEEVTGYLGVVLALQEATGGMLSTVAVVGRHDGAPTMESERG